MEPTILNPHIEETICAIATPSGTSAMGVVKVSGAEALAVTDRIFRPAKKDLRLTESEGYRAHYGWVVEPESGERIDDVVVLVFRAPHSYTGEEQVEISCHGSPYILSLVVKALIAAGARLAEAGEFSRRAFANGKMDLSQAEAVADLIASNSRASHRMSLTQVRGLFRAEIEGLREQLIHFASLLELELDFSEEDVEFVSRDELLRVGEEIHDKISDLYKSYDAGQVIKNGIPIAIVGSTNAGKSTLLNSLLREERAIVSDIHGTTRDTIEEVLRIEGQEFRLIDTAGLRQTDDQIESIGIERTYSKIADASLVLWLIDGSVGHDADSLKVDLDQLLTQTTVERISPVINKIDLMTEVQVEQLSRQLAELGLSEVLIITAKEKGEADKIRAFLHQHFAYLEVAEGDVVVSNLRQATALKSAAQELGTALQGLRDALPTDLVAQDLRASIAKLSEVTGDITSDTILHSVFSHFCIGK
ncbi:MAG: tRNA uridine-5-carboxymethylaminomethyl(34) synthesis GTPase MnmE [Porphyromonas sp.]|nr:tRNA uridine-5-carboxymethylaminomethyl(34) synthesis GTPase MnmE [Porphyromonas sp.]